MSRGNVWQRHTRTCPRDEDGTFASHRCRGTWGYRVDAGRAPNGRRRQVTRSGFATKRDAQRALDDVVQRLDGGATDAENVTVAAFLEEWIDGKRRLRDTTRRNYTSHIHRYLVPALGRLRLPDLRPTHIDQLYADLLSGRYTGTSAATVHHVHRTLRAALNTALKRRLITWNPALHIELPEHRRPRTTVWEPTSIAVFLDTAGDHRLYTLFHLLTFTGMRRGEALGLHWSDVDLELGHLRVEWQVTDAGRGPRLGAPKTEAGRRVVPLDPATLAILREHRQSQAAERAVWPVTEQDLDLVFTRENGDLLRPDGVTHLFRQIVERAGVPRIRLHDLRHTHARIAMAAGIDVKIVSDRLGHSSTVITRDLYTHVVPEVARSAADAIAAAVAYRGRPQPADVHEKCTPTEPEKGGRDPP